MTSRDDYLGGTGERSSIGVEETISTTVQLLDRRDRAQRPIAGTPGLHILLQGTPGNIDRPEMRGTLVVAPPRDTAELTRFSRRTEGWSRIDGEALGAELSATREIRIVLRKGLLPVLASGQ